MGIKRRRQILQRLNTLDTGITEEDKLGQALPLHPRGAFLYRKKFSEDRTVASRNHL